MEFITRSAQETEKLAQKIIRDCWDAVSKKCLFLALAGELGTGKTVFAKGIGKFLGIKIPVRSPGYLIIREYSFACRGTKGMFYHVDLWRVKEEETVALEIDKLIKPGNIIVLEWAQKAPGLLKKLRKRKDLKLISVEFAHKGEDKREIKIANS